jgi:hypothetical protein
MVAKVLTAALYEVFGGYRHGGLARRAILRQHSQA